MSVRIQRGALSIARAYAELEDAGSGAAIVFAGRVRPDPVGSRPATALLYEMHRPLTDRSLERLERMARERYGARRVVIWHRLGPVKVGEASVLVGVAAAHRAPAFQAARKIMEQLKHAAPIWKTAIVESPRPLRSRRRDS
ncbi:MAG: molybdenum cofactor biosynthesis protein MoaE [Thermoplasmata archaeon]